MSDFFLFNLSSITTNVVSSNPSHGMANSIQHYVMKFVSDLRQVGPISSTKKIDRHDKTEKLLKVALNTNVSCTIFFFLFVIYARF